MAPHRPQDDAGPVFPRLPYPWHGSKASTRLAPSGGQLGPGPGPGGRSGPHVWADAAARWRGRATVLARCRALASPRYFAAALATGNVASLPRSLPGMWLRHRATYLQP